MLSVVLARVEEPSGVRALDENFGGAFKTWQTHQIAKLGNLHATATHPNGPIQELFGIFVDG